MKVSGIAAVVAGGASGMGDAAARGLADAGAKVFVLDLPDAIEKAETVTGVTYVPADVTSPNQIQDAVDQAAAAAPLRVAVICAGVAAECPVLSEKGAHDLDMYRKVIEINLIGTFNVLRLAAEAMARTEADEDGQRGVVVNTASIAAFDGPNGQVAYSSSKGGVVGMTMPAARDLASSGIRVVTIAPGPVDTPMFDDISDESLAPLIKIMPFPKRAGLPAEYAKLVLAVIDNDYINGEVVRLDGGLRMPHSSQAEHSQP